MSAPLVSTLALDCGAAHDVVRVWTRGGLAGTLTFTAGDGRKWCDGVAVAFGLDATGDRNDLGWARWVAREAL